MPDRTVKPLPLLTHVVTGTGLDELFAEWMVRGPFAIRELGERDPVKYLTIMVALFSGAELQERH